MPNDKWKRERKQDFYVCQRTNGYCIAGSQPGDDDDDDGHVKRSILTILLHGHCLPLEDTGKPQRGVSLWIVPSPFVWHQRGWEGSKTWNLTLVSYFKPSSRVGGRVLRCCLALQGRTRMTTMRTNGVVFEWKEIDTKRGPFNETEDLKVSLFCFV